MTQENKKTRAFVNVGLNVKVKEELQRLTKESGEKSISRYLEKTYLTQEEE